MDRDQDLLRRLWLNLYCEHNPAKIQKHIDAFGSAEAVYETSPAQLLRMAETWKHQPDPNKSLDGAKWLLDQCRHKGIRILSVDDPEYPDRLRQIWNPPQILYVKGTLPDLDRLLCITIVGTRRVSEAGVKYARQFSYGLASCGALVVSGMASGGDAAAHWGALDAGHNTVAVLAGGVDIIYPSENTALYYEILRHGAVLSERPPGQIGKSYFYQERNRILAGLSQGCIAVRAPVKSGVSFTTQSAREYNRDLFAVPGAPGEEMAELENDLIQQGAKLVTTTNHVLEDYLNIYPQELEYGLTLIDPARKRKLSEETAHKTAENPRRRGTQCPPKVYEQFEGTDRIILKYLYDNNGTALKDEIARDCGIPTDVLSTYLLALVMRHALTAKPGSLYMLTEPM